MVGVVSERPAPCALGIAASTSTRVIGDFSDAFQSWCPNCAMKKG
jgi:hypothetical protein